jgi:hypothetical protein
MIEGVIIDFFLSRCKCNGVISWFNQGEPTMWFDQLGWTNTHTNVFIILNEAF